MTTRAPLLLAPNANALPAPPAPTSTNVFPVSGDGRGASPFAHGDGRGASPFVHRPGRYEIMSNSVSN